MKTFFFPKCYILLNLSLKEMGFECGSISFKNRAINDEREQTHDANVTLCLSEKSFRIYNSFETSFMLKLP